MAADPPGGGPLAADQGTAHVEGFEDVPAILEPFCIDTTDNLVSGGKGESCVEFSVLEAGKSGRLPTFTPG